MKLILWFLLVIFTPNILSLCVTKINETQIIRYCKSEYNCNTCSLQPSNSLGLILDILPNNSQHQLCSLSNGLLDNYLEIICSIKVQGSHVISYCKELNVKKTDSTIQSISYYECITDPVFWFGVISCILSLIFDIVHGESVTNPMFFTISCFGLAVYCLHLYNIKN